VTEETIRVEVAYARKQEQALLAVQGPPGLTIADAIARSGMIERFPEIDLGVNKVGVFGKVATLETELADGDRVEIYPPLIADPKQARKARAAKAGGTKAAASKPARAKATAET
jgi:putative ubiquitin-RnfH superfamily antitoxin RatB of RatAB toxin-antitoxin module